MSRTFFTRLYHTAFFSFSWVFFKFVFFLPCIFVWAGELCKTFSRYCSAFICKIKYFSSKLSFLLFYFPLCPQFPQQEIGQEWCEMNSWRCGWRAVPLFCRDGRKMGEEISLKIADCVLIFIRYLSKQHKTVH